MTKNLHIRTKACRRVLILGFPNVLMMDIAGPAQVFGSANTLLGQCAYQIDLVTATGSDAVTDTGLPIGAKFSFENAPQADDFILPGGPGVNQLLYDTTTLAFIQRMAKTADRVISICSGSLLAAAAGVLDGKHATSHWERSEEVFQRFPGVNWQLDKIFTCDGRFYCSAGVTAGIDLALSILESDHGRRMALAVAREMVVFMQRHGGQSQFSRPLQAQSTSHQRLSDLYSRIEADPAANWTVQMMANLVGTTERTLHRDFRRDMNMSPSQYVENRRIGIARTYLERSPDSLKKIARLSGYVSEQNMRRSFQKLLGILPSDYRQRFGNVDPEADRW